MLRTWMGFALFGSIAAGAAATGACGTDAVAIETCRQIEEARCRQAPNCPNIDLGHPVHRDSPKSDVDACIRFYKDACMHGLATNADPGGPATKACIDAINTGNCDIVYHPETAPACAWLIPPQPPPPADAGPDSDADADAAKPADSSAIVDVGLPDIFG